MQRALIDKTVYVEIRGGKETLELIAKNMYLRSRTVLKSPTITEWEPGEPRRYGQGNLWVLPLRFRRHNVRAKDNLASDIARALRQCKGLKKGTTNARPFIHAGPRYVGNS